MKKVLKKVVLSLIALITLGMTSCSKDDIKSVFTDKGVVGTWYLTNKTGYYMSTTDASEKYEWNTDCTILTTLKDSEVLKIKSDNYYLIAGYNDGEQFTSLGGYLYTNVVGVYRRLTLTNGLPTSFDQFQGCLSTYSVNEISDTKLVLSIRMNDI